MKKVKMKKLNEFNVKFMNSQKINKNKYDVMAITATTA